MLYNYRRDVVEQLWHHGVHPKTSTLPQVVFDFVNDLYRYELRRLKARLVRGDIPKAGYYDRVVDLRRKYPLVSLNVREWAQEVPDAVDSQLPTPNSR
jgi:hypothetical protein